MRGSRFTLGLLLAMIPARASLTLVALLLILRAVMAGLLPLSADEAYYWLWSKHLAAGYYDHPPAIAWLIRAGTLLFGDTPLGVRLMSVVLSFPASWFVWKAGKLILNDDNRAGLALLFFNLTLMTSVELLAATPDMPSVVTSAAFLYCLAQIQATQNGKWWLAAGIAAGLGLLSKFSALFLGVGALFWLMADGRERPWLASPWPYLGAGLALLIFSPNLVWQSQHHWETFLFQFGRVGGGHFTLRYLGEFLAAQMGLATPLLFLLMLLGLGGGTRQGSRLLLPAILIWTGTGYFLEHALHDRVQGNWPCFLYPAFAVAAAGAMLFWSGRFAKAEMWSARLAIPVSAALLALCYLQAFFGVLPIGRSDPFARLLGFGIADVTRQLDPGAAILATDYETTSWFAFYGHQPVAEIDDDQRWASSPGVGTEFLSRPLLYVAEQNRDHHDLVDAHFAHVVFLGTAERRRGGKAVAHYVIYRVSGPHGSAVGRVP